MHMQSAGRICTEESAWSRQPSPPYYFSDPSTGKKSLPVETVNPRQRRRDYRRDIARKTRIRPGNFARVFMRETRRLISRRQPTIVVVRGYPLCECIPAFYCDRVEGLGRKGKKEKRASERERERERKKERDR
ncbi:hypothetical protein PUN28_015479 [Cardiocondyla obscurior]|uniref:Uncharacterized protein n=1 Tax=Cardiocondyla obscurior TaxID=286306 RepID=A0AAW2EZC4_9HYME